MKKYAPAVGVGVMLFIALAVLIRAEPNQILMSQLAVGSVSRIYRLVVPHRLSQPAPIVFAFHGSGDSPESMARYSNLDSLAASNGFLLVYPTPAGGTWSVDANEEDSNPDIHFLMS